MFEIDFLTILLVVTCFLGGVVSVTDKEFEVCTECDSTLICESSAIKINRFITRIDFLEERFCVSS